MSPRRSSLAVLALLLSAPVAALPSAVEAAPADAVVRTRDAAHSNPNTVVRRLATKVNLGKRAQARNWATRPVVRRLFGLKADGFTLRYPHDNCHYVGAADGDVCRVRLWQDGVSPGYVDLVVRGPEGELKAVRSGAVIDGES